MSEGHHTYSEDDLLMLSALQHLLFCERQCALIHIEQLWAENLFTAQGMILHERVDRPGHESRRGVRIEYGVPIRSLRLGLSGKTDVIEYHLQEDGVWLPFPVEYKRGKPKKDNSDRVQICAQALCLEEMLHIAVEKGALFYGKQRRRHEVVFNAELRRATEDAAHHLHKLIANGITPEPVYGKQCDSCSLLGICLPKLSRRKRQNVESYLAEAIKEPA